MRRGNLHCVQFLDLRGEQVVPSRDAGSTGAQGSAHPELEIRCATKTDITISSQSMFHPSPRSIRALTHHSPLRPSPLHRSPLRPSPRFAHHHFIAASLPRHLIRCPTRPKALRAGGFNGYAIDADPHPSTGMGRWLPEENEANMRTELADPGRFEFLKNCNIVIA